MEQGPLLMLLVTAALFFFFLLSQDKMAAVTNRVGHSVDFIDCVIQLKAPELAGEWIFNGQCFSISILKRKSWSG